MSAAPGSTPFDLLREKRQELNLPDPVEVAVQGRQRLLQGLAIGSALIGVALMALLLLLLRGLMVRSAVSRLETVEAEEQLFETQLSAARGKLKKVEQANADLVKGLIALRSGSAFLRDLQMRVPAGVQLTAATEEAGGYRLKGVSGDPQAFAKINALQLQLKRSPLLDPNGVTLVKASRGEAGSRSTAPATTAAAASAPVTFELSVKSRPPISPLAEKQILTELGSAGLVRRFDLLQQEGLL